MNPFYNPVFIGKVLKSYLFDVNRLRRWHEDDLHRYQDKQLKRLIRFAWNVPVYHEKYRAAGIHPSDITGMKDLSRLPLMNKEDIQHHYPEGIIPSIERKEHLVEIATSGTTGKSLRLYVDMFSIVMGLLAYARTVREYGLHERKTKMTVIGDFATHTAESGYISRGLQPQLNLSKLFSNIQWLNTNDDPKKLLEEINSFNPEFIGGYVGMLGHLALLKEQGLGKDIAPRFIAATGSVLDPTLKNFIEKSFHAHLFEVYGATESGLVGFQCRQGKYHIMSDLVHLEFLMNGQPVSPGEAGKIVITKFYGGGTPVIRYDAMNDIVASSNHHCSCGMVGELLQKIYGRDDLSIILPDGRAMLPTSFSEVYSKLLYELKTTKLQNSKIIQHDLTTIEVDLVLDKNQQHNAPSSQEICSFVQQEFQKKVGPSITVHVKEVDSVDKNGPRIVSMLDRSKIHISKYV